MLQVIPYRCARNMRYDVVYVNFTDGLAALREDGLPRARSIVVTRMRSGHLERGDWEKWLWSVPDDLLYRIATGQRILFVDAGSRRPDGVPRTIWMGLPVLLHVLHRLWWGEKIPFAQRYLGHILGPRAAHVDMHAEEVYRSLSKSLRNRLAYWRWYATPRPRYTLVAAYTKAALTMEEAKRLEQRLRALMTGHSEHRQAPEVVAPA